METLGLAQKLKDIKADLLHCNTNALSVIVKLFKSGTSFTKLYSKFKIHPQHCFFTIGFCTRTILTSHVNLKGLRE